MQGHYSHPDPMPEDLYIKYGIPSEQGYFMVGSKGTGNFLPSCLQCRDNGNDFSFPVLSPFLKLNNNELKSFLNGYPIF